MKCQLCIFTQTLLIGKVAKNFEITEDTAEKMNRGEFVVIYSSISDTLVCSTSMENGGPCRLKIESKELNALN